MQRGRNNLGQGGTTTTISPVNLSRSFVSILSSLGTTAGPTGVVVQNHFLHVQLENETTLRLSGWGIIEWQVVTFL